MIIDFIITFAILILFLGTWLYYGLIMKFRIVQRHNGERYRYCVQTLGLFGWRDGKGYILSRSHDSCKEAEEAIDNYSLMVKTENVILEKEI